MYCHLQKNKKRLAKNSAGSDAICISIILFKNLISKSKVATSNEPFNDFFNTIDIKHKIFRRFPSVSYAVVINR